MNSLENWFCSSGFWRNLTQRKWLPWLLEDVDLGENVLEVGAGPGAATAELARHARNVTSLEYSHRFCVSLRAKVGAESVVQGDASALPFEAGTFTGAVAVLVLHHLRSKDAQDRAFAEICRALKPGGVLAALEIEDSWLSRLLHIRSTFVPVSPRGLRTRLLASGFSTVDLKVVSGGFRLRARKLNNIAPTP